MCLPPSRGSSVDGPRSGRLSDVSEQDDPGAFMLELDVAFRYAIRRAEMRRGRAKA